jgi:LPXTG-site transpeptidase (sortase) family protein
MKLLKAYLKGRILIVSTIVISIIWTGATSFFVYKYFDKTSPEILVASADVELPLLQINLPVRLSIPSIEVDANVEYVGLASDGSMGVPKGPLEVAWYMLGPKPGENGSSVIDGHAGWARGEPAVFDNLYKMKIGDKIYVENYIGEITTFVVRELKIYSPNANAEEVFISDDGGSHLNLITCTGLWDKIEKNHASRLVVFADKEIK